VKGKRPVDQSVQLVLPLELREGEANGGASTHAGPAERGQPPVASTGPQTSGARREAAHVKAPSGSAQVGYPGRSRMR